ncbi:NepR family anti-sigma factor [Acidisphaera rubrifaciens]|uniref:Anti-sigma factor NepR domain-containing protein n=1 Tax=Acidisphaera rubrifaciens HS-AP3 TaxID=1231350 RepID=A0A0D6P9G6_9PROT|nr:NepR family anti-sigma factor [Acidisphaera rubrifaciens]GAN78001.1 hypothetical protein Asru_0566_04 [Acidisphaera rubrifaciens HS-AP3]
MADKDAAYRRRPPGSGGTPPSAGTNKTDAAFDVWLQRSLHQLYDTVAREPIPDELLRLIEADRAKPEAQPDEA